MGNKLKEFVTAAGLSVLLTTSALGQENKDVDLKTIEADSISITTTDGRVVFNQASGSSAAATTSAPATPAQPATSRRRGAGNDQQTGETPAAGTGTRTRIPGMALNTVDDCLSISSEFISRTARQSGGTGSSSRERVSPSARTTAPSTTYTATCYNDGKEVAKITFEAGKTTPVVTLVEREEGPAPQN